MEGNAGPSQRWRSHLQVSECFGRSNGDTTRYTSGNVYQFQLKLMPDKHMQFVKERLKQADICT